MAAQAMTEPEATDNAAGDSSGSRPPIAVSDRPASGRSGPASTVSRNTAGEMTQL